MHTYSLRSHIQAATQSLETDYEQTRATALQGFTPVTPPLFSVGRVPATSSSARTTTKDCIRNARKNAKSDSERVKVEVDAPTEIFKVQLGGYRVANNGKGLEKMSHEDRSALIRTYLLVRHGNGKGVRVVDQEGRLVVYLASPLHDFNQDDLIKELERKLRYHESDSTGAKDPNPRGDHRNNTFGYHATYSQTPMEWAKGAALRLEIDTAIQGLSTRLGSISDCHFPTQVQRDGPYGGHELVCINRPTEGTTNVPAQPVACQCHRDVLNTMCKACWVYPMGEWDMETQSLLVIHELGIMIQVPPGCAVMYSSSMFTHENINIRDYFSVPEWRGMNPDAIIPLDYQFPTSIFTRWSIVFFTQASHRRRLDIIQGIAHPLADRGSKLPAAGKFELKAAGELKALAAWPTELELKDLKRAAEQVQMS